MNRFKDSDSFEDLTAKRHTQILSEQGIIVDDVKVHPATFQDTSWATLEQLADANTLLDFEIAKAQSKGLLMEARRLTAIKRSIVQAGHDLFKVREAYREKAPELLEGA